MNSRRILASALGLGNCSSCLTYLNFSQTGNFKERCMITIKQIASLTRYAGLVKILPFLYNDFDVNKFALKTQVDLENDSAQNYF